MKALVVGGTGPTGHYLVNGLLARGYQVAMLHTGRHEVDEIPDTVEHIHTDPFDETALRTALGERTFDLTLATYGRLRRIAGVMRGRTGRFISIGGGPAYRGYMNPGVLHPVGMPMPIAEDAPLLMQEGEDAKGWRIVKTEAAVFEQHPNATHFRYPFVYGRYQIAPREWCVVRRVLDRRPFIILPDDGLSLCHFGGAENLAHAVLLAVDQPDAAAGEIFNCGDELVLTLRQAVEVMARALDYPLAIVSMPWQFATPSRPLVAQPWTTHRVFDIAKLKARLGYRDVVSPLVGVAEAAQWLAAHPLPYGGTAEKVLQDVFDYAAEDALVKAWCGVLAQMPDVPFVREPGYGAAYSGPGGKPRSSEWTQ